jgi:hypothetical protein
MKGLSLYDFPELYHRLRTPEEREFNRIFELVTTYLGRLPGSVMDPACGPATWLVNFAQKNIPVAGNDICAAMVESAQKKLGQMALEIIEGDMCDLRFEKGPFDVTLEVSGTCGLLADIENFRKFLGTIIDHTAPGGLILLTTFFAEKEAEELPCLVDQWGPVEVTPGGRAWICYEILGTEPSRSVDFVRRTVRTSGIEECPGPLIDEYEMFTWKEDHFFEIISEFPALEFLCAVNLYEPGMPLSDNNLHGEATVIFRRN